MLAPQLRIRIRPASTSLADHTLFLAFVDSQLPYLSSIGSADQWGTDIFSTNPDLIRKYRESIQKGEEQAAGGGAFGAEWVRAFIAEKKEEEGDGEWRAVGAMILEGKAVEYARRVLRDREGEFLFVKFVVTDRGRGKGAGKVLLEHAEGMARGLGLERVCLDCWRGNGRGLVQFYERMGYVWLGDVVESEGAQDEWPAAVLEKRLR